MELGQLVDFIIEYNNSHSEETHEESGKRKATQKDWDMLLG